MMELLCFVRDVDYAVYVFAKSQILPLRFLDLCTSRYLNFTK